jgi:hypothetical protein
MEHLDLREAAFTEVLARVAFQLIKRDYACYRSMYEEPARGMLGLAALLRAHGWSVMSTWVTAYSMQWSDFTPIGLIRERMVFAARCGQEWRRIVYPAYKAGRRDDPRVTNRGVISPRRTRGER